MYVKLLSSTCFGPWRAHPQEEQLHKHRIWYPRSHKQLYTTPVESRLLSPGVVYSDDTRCCVCAVVPPEDGHVKDRNMSRIVMWHTCVIELCIKVGWRNNPILWCTVGKTLKKSKQGSILRLWSSGYGRVKNRVTNEILKNIKILSTNKCTLLLNT